MFIILLIFEKIKTFQKICDILYLFYFMVIFWYKMKGDEIRHEEKRNLSDNDNRYDR